jgi:type IV secretory pathway VirJ component
MWFVLALALGLPAVASEGERIGIGRFGEVVVYRPATKPSSVVLFVSGDGGWHLGVVGMAQHMVEAGSIVVGIDMRHYRDVVNTPTNECRNYGADFEALSHAVQKQLQLEEYFVPVLAGYSSGATLVYAVMVQSPPGTFAGVMSLGFCPDLDLVRQPCRGSGLEYDLQGSAAKPKGLVYRPAPANRTRWVVLQGEADQVCNPRSTREFVAATAHGELIALPKVGHGFGVERNWLPRFEQAYGELAGANAQPPPLPGLSDLPLVEVPADRNSGGTDRDHFAVLLTGDGGWTGLDQDVSHALAARGIPVVALSSLKYFWHARTPEGAAHDLERIVNRYAAQWDRRRVLLIGYSFGADVLPFLYNRLSPTVRKTVQSISLLGLSDTATFEFHLSNWIAGSSGNGLPTVPEIAAIQGTRVLCLHGADEKHTACRALHAPGIKTLALAGGHHFDGDYATLARHIVAYADAADP